LTYAPHADPEFEVRAEAHRYHQKVFLVPPWPAIYVAESERRHNFIDSVAEYQRLLDLYPSLGYEVTILPKVGVHERADFVLRALTE
jgi:predicted ATPase